MTKNNGWYGRKKASGDDFRFMENPPLPPSSYENRNLNEIVNRLAILLQQPIANQSEEIKLLFDQIIQNSTEFLIKERSENIIVYADPTDSSNPNKFITYIYDDIKWQVIPGKDASAIIPNQNDNQLLFVNGNNVQVNGNKNGVFSTDQLSINNYQLSLFYELNKALEYSGVKSNTMFLFTIPSNKQMVFNELVYSGSKENPNRSFTKVSCDHTRSLLINELETKFSANMLCPMPYAIPYSDGDYQYFWYGSKETPVGIRVRNSRAEIILSDDYEGNPVAAMLKKGWKKGNTVNGHHHPDQGYSGGAILSANNVNSTYHTSNPHPTTQHLVPENPVLSNAPVRMTRHEIDTHLQKALLVNTQRHVPNISRLVKDKPQPRAFTERVNHLTLKTIPKVVSGNGIQLQLHCSFEAKAKDADFNDHDATIYVFKYPGTVVTPNDNSHLIPGAVIVEVTKGGNVFLRASSTNNGICDDNNAAVTINGQTANINNIGGDLSISLPEGSIFKDNGFHNSFMCFEGCCAHYGTENIAKMLNPPVIWRSL